MYFKFKTEKPISISKIKIKIKKFVKQEIVIVTSYSQLTYILLTRIRRRLHIIIDPTERNNMIL